MKKNDPGKQRGYLREPELENDQPNFISAEGIPQEATFSPPPFELHATTVSEIEPEEAMETMAEPQADEPQFAEPDPAEDTAADPPEENKTGIPDEMKANFENAFEIDLSDVRVIYNSGVPAKFGAKAFAAGNKVHLGPGNDHLLAHELAHIVQQKRGQVKPTHQMGGKGLNDSEALEREADAMAAMAMSMTTKAAPESAQLEKGTGDEVIQRVTAQIIPKDPFFLETLGSTFEVDSGSNNDSESSESSSSSEDESTYQSDSSESSGSSEDEFIFKRKNSSGLLRKRSSIEMLAPLSDMKQDGNAMSEDEALMDEEHLPKKRRVEKLKGTIAVHGAMEPSTEDVEMEETGVATVENTELDVLVPDQENMGTGEEDTTMESAVEDRLPAPDHDPDGDPPEPESEPVPFSLPDMEIDRVVIHGRPQKRFGAVTGDHTTAFSVGVEGIRRSVEGVTFRVALKNMFDLFTKLEKMGQPYRLAKETHAAIKLGMSAESTESNLQAVVQFQLYIKRWLEEREKVPGSLINTKMLGVSDFGKNRGEHVGLHALRKAEDEISEGGGRPSMASVADAIVSLVDTKAISAVLTASPEKRKANAPGFDPENFSLDQVESQFRLHYQSLKPAFPQLMELLFPTEELFFSRLLGYFKGTIEKEIVDVLKKDIEKVVDRYLMKMEEEMAPDFAARRIQNPDRDFVVGDDVSDDELALGESDAVERKMKKKKKWVDPYPEATEKIEGICELAKDLGLEGFEFELKEISRDEDWESEMEDFETTIENYNPMHNLEEIEDGFDEMDKDSDTEMDDEKDREAQHNSEEDAARAKRDPNSAWIRLGSQNQITEIEIEGRPKSPFGSGNEGAHATAWCLRVAMVEKRLVKKRMSPAFDEIIMIADECHESNEEYWKLVQDRTARKAKFAAANRDSDDSTDDDATDYNAAYLLDEVISRRLREAFNEKYNGLKALNFFDGVEHPAQILLRLQRAINLLLQVMNFQLGVTFDTLGDRKGKGEGSALNKLKDDFNEHNLNGKEIGYLIMKLLDLPEETPESHAWLVKEHFRVVMKALPELMTAHPGLKTKFFPEYLSLRAHEVKPAYDSLMRRFEVTDKEKNQEMLQDLGLARIPRVSVGDWKKELEQGPRPENRFHEVIADDRLNARNNRPQRSASPPTFFVPEITDIRGLGTLVDEYQSWGSPFTKFLESKWEAEEQVDIDAFRTKLTENYKGSTPLPTDDQTFRRYLEIPHLRIFWLVKSKYIQRNMERIEKAFQKRFSNRG